MLLINKNAVVYGASGAIGSAVAKAFAREGANVFCVGRTQAKLEKLAENIRDSGGSAAVFQVDVMNQKAVQENADIIVNKAGGIDISFNAISLGGLQGTPLFEMSQENFALPVLNAMAAHFFTTTAAIRHMASQGSGVVLSVTAQVARKPYPNIGGFGVACAAIEGFYRQLALESGEYGIRVICLRSSGSPDTPGVDEVWRQHAKNAGISREEWENRIADKTLLKRLPKLAEVANAAVIMASGYASAITSAITNVTCGEIID